MLIRKTDQNVKRVQEDLGLRKKPSAKIWDFFNFQQFIFLPDILLPCTMHSVVK